MKQTDWRDRYEIMLERAKFMDDIYGHSQDALRSFSSISSYSAPHLDWFLNRKNPLYNIKLVRVPFLSKQALDWMKKVREIEPYYRAGGGKKQIESFEAI